MARVLWCRLRRRWPLVEGMSGWIGSGMLPWVWLLRRVAAVNSLAEEGPERPGTYRSAGWGEVISRFGVKEWLRRGRCWGGVVVGTC